MNLVEVRAALYPFGALISEANFQCECYRVMVNAGWIVGAEISTPYGRLDLVVFELIGGRAWVKAVVECKQSKKKCGRDTVQHDCLKRLGVPFFWLGDERDIPKVMASIALLENPLPLVQLLSGQKFSELRKIRNEKPPKSHKGLAVEMDECLFIRS